MNTFGRTPSVTDKPEGAGASLRPGTVRRLGAYTTVRLTADGPAPVTVFVDGEIDLACADELTALLCGTLETHPQGIDVNLASVDFFDCRGLRVLLDARVCARRLGRYFAVGAHSPAVGRLLEMTNTRSLLTAPR